MELLDKRPSQAINTYLGSEGVLRPHQLEVFQDFGHFFANPVRKGMVEFPTGTGKTVIFVELSKALLSNPEQYKPKILVVTPSVDLVHQTLGRKGQKGYGKFAPDLRVGSYFSGTPAEERTDEAIASADVLVTTYRSFGLMSRKLFLDRSHNLSDQGRNRSNFVEFAEGMGYHTALRYFKTIPSGVRSFLDQFDIFILDEAHHLFGKEASDIIDSLPKDKWVIGLTATPDKDEEHQLINYLPFNIHTLGLNEAIWLNLLAPVAALGIRSGIRVQGSNIYTDKGDYIDRKIRYLAEDPRRNSLIIEAAKTMSSHGIGTIISCIAGDQAWQARYLAERLTKEGVSAVAVHKDIKGTDRQEIYRQFEEGKIDILTFVGVLGEGWDSSRAKGLINARPTRSLIFSKQRLGRITRPEDLAFAIDIVDEYDQRNPAITVSDVIDEGDIDLGSVIGNTGDSSLLESVITSLKTKLPVMSVLPSGYRSYEDVLTILPTIDNGAIDVEQAGKIKKYVVARRVAQTYKGITDEILEKLQQLTGIIVDKKDARQGNSIRTVYNVVEAYPLLSGLPEIDVFRYHIDKQGQKWISTQGLFVLFSKRYPELTHDIVMEQLESIGDGLDWIPACHRPITEKTPYTRFQVVKLHRVDNKTTDLLNQKLADYFSVHTSI